MKVFGLLLSLCVGASALGSGQAVPGKSAKQPFSISISAEKTDVEVGSPVEIHIRLTNTSTHEISSTASYDGPFNYSYQYEVWTAKGRLVRPKKLEGHRIAGSVIFGTLKPGEAAEDGTELAPYYDLPPGTYFIQVARPVSENSAEGVIKSNKIRIVVTPAESTSTPR